MEHYYTNYSKCCSNCRCNIFIIREGYIICSACGFIVQSLTNENFTPIGYRLIEQKKGRRKRRN